jgi:hypothetical protein
MTGRISRCLSLSPTGITMKHSQHAKIVSERGALHGSLFNTGGNGNFKYTDIVPRSQSFQSPLCGDSFWQTQRCQTKRASLLGSLPSCLGTLHTVNSLFSVTVQRYAEESRGHWSLPDPHFFTPMFSPTASGLQWKHRNRLLNLRSSRSPM